MSTQNRLPSQRVKAPTNQSVGATLQGIRVLDLTRILAGPFATMQLGDLGAEIIKVEPPAGDDSRSWGPPWVSGESAYFVSVNRNKRSIQLNLSTSLGQEALRRLALDADVLVENFKVGTMEKWGLGYEDHLAKMNPRLVYCSITGYGRTGPSADLPGYDPAIEAVSGLMSITGQPDGPPTKVGVAVVDVLTGCQASFGIISALMYRERSGLGQRVDVSLFETALAALANQASAYLISGQIPERHGNAHPAIVPFEVFETLDRPVMVCAGSDGLFQRLCAMLDVPELAKDERFTTNPRRVEHREELVSTLQSRFLDHPSAYLVETAERVGVPVAPVNDLDQVFLHPQVAARDMVIEIDHPTVGTFRQVGFPIKFGLTPASVKRPPPLLGQHTEEVLRELGFAAEDVQKLLDEVTQ